MASAKGELSLVVAKGGQDVGAITSAVLPILGVVTMVTTFMTPYILRFGSKLGNVSQSSSLDSKKGRPVRKGTRIVYYYYCMHTHVQNQYLVWSDLHHFCILHNQNYEASTCPHSWALKF